MNLTHLKRYSPEKVQALFGLTRSAWGAVLAKVLPELRQRRQVAHARRPDRQRAGGGGRRRGRNPYQEVRLTLSYLRHNVAPAVVGELFGGSADTSANTSPAVVFGLRAVCPAQRWEAEKRWKKGAPRWIPDPGERALSDSCDSPVRRPSRQDRQKRVYAGQKKRHPLKRQVVTAAKGEILDLLTLDSGDRGPTKGSLNRARSGSTPPMPQSRALRRPKGSPE